MIIVSQDKMKIFNFDEIFKLCVEDWSNEEFAIERFYIKAEKSSDNMICALLGEYKTEERAKEVLEEITDMYCRCNSEYGSIGYVRNRVYKMPKE